MKLIRPMILIGLAGLTSCAHGTRRGSVAMKVSANEAHVSMGDKEVEVGDKVTLFKNVCGPISIGRAGGDRSPCKKVKLGDGEVTEVLNDHYSTIRIEPGVPFTEGTVVEKK